MVLWFVGAVLALGLLRYRPLRYELLLIPPMCALAALTLSNFVKARPIKVSTAASRIGCFIGLIPLFYQGLYRACEGMIRSGLRLPGLVPDDFPPVLIWPHWLVSVFVAAVVMALMIAWFLPGLIRRMSPWWQSLEPRILWSIAGTIIFSSIAVQIGHHFRSYQLMKYDTLAASRDIRDVIGPGSVVAGALADVVTIETNYSSCTYSNFKGDIDKVLERCPDATHLITSVSNLPPLNWKTFQSLRSESLIPIRAYQIGPRRRSLIISGQLQRASVLEIVFRINCGKYSAPTAYERGVMQVLEGDEPAAIIHFQRFLEHHPGHVPTLLQLAVLTTRNAAQSPTSSPFFERALNRVQSPEKFNEHDLRNFIRLQGMSIDNLVP